MVYKYDYISPCCNNAYSETRSEADPIVNPMCNVCKQQAYELVTQTELNTSTVSE